MTYTENDILLHVGPRALEAGRIYQKQRRVTDFENHGGGVMTARVQGNERRPYHQDITVTRTAAGKTVIESDCSCPVGENCKHIAAALLEGLARASAPFARNDAFGLPRAPPPGHRHSPCLGLPRRNCRRISPCGSIRWKRRKRATRRTMQRPSRSASFMCWRRRPIGWASHG